MTTSKRIVELADTQAALRRGELSASQAEPIAGAASHMPDAEAHLLGMAATSTLAELREECARRKAAGDPDPEATYRRIHENRYLRRRRDGEGGWNLTARGTPDAGALFNSSLDPIIDDIFHAAWAEGRRDERQQYAFDALLEMARRARDGYDPQAEHNDIDQANDRDEAGHADDIDAAGPGDEVPTCAVGAGDGHGPDWTEGDPKQSSTTGEDHHSEANHGAASGAGAQGRDATTKRAPRQTARRKKRSRKIDNPTYLALLRIDFEALLRGHIEDDEICEISGVGPIPVGRARELLSESVIKLIATKGKQVVNVTHYGRKPTVAQRMALLWSQPACTVQGCNHAFTQIDHRLDWHQTHHTRLSELDRLCHHHHRLKTNHGWALVPGTGKRTMVSPDDPRHPDNQRKPTSKAA